MFEESVNKVSVLTVIVSGAQRVLTRRLADPVGGNGSAPFAQLLPEVPVHTYASTTGVVPAFQSIRFNMRGNSTIAQLLAWFSSPTIAPASQILIREVTKIC